MFLVRADLYKLSCIVFYFVLNLCRSHASCHPRLKQTLTGRHRFKPLSFLKHLYISARFIIISLMHVCACSIVRQQAISLFTHNESWKSTCRAYVNVTASALVRSTCLLRWGLADSDTSTPYVSTIHSHCFFLEITVPGKCMHFKKRHIYMHACMYVNMCMLYLYLTQSASRGQFVTGVVLADHL